MIGLLKSYCQFANQVEGKLETYFQLVVEFGGGSEQRYRRWYPDVREIARLQLE